MSNPGILQVMRQLFEVQGKLDDAVREKNDAISEKGQLREQLQVCDEPPAVPI